MKSCVIILVLAVAVGFGFVVANTVSKQPVTDKDLLLSESNDSSTNQEETLNNSGIEQKKIEANENGETKIAMGDRPDEETLEIDIEENIQSPIDQFDYKGANVNQLDLQDDYNNQFDLQEPVIDTNPENEFELVKEGDYYYNDVIYKDPNEIMETAAGFVPIPILRKKKKQPPRRQYVTRRYNRRPYASRRQFYFYPYYRYYRPSFLRYYYF